MKKSILNLSLLMILALSTTQTLFAANEPVLIHSTITPNKENKSQAEIELRIKEIKKMDLSMKSKSERKQLKQELRQMKKLSDGVYLSGGALLLIVVLLILLI